MNMIQTLVAFVAALVILIFVHELGHYLVARWCGVKILKFSIGFGRPLLTWHVGTDRTEWCLSAIPLGGFRKILYGFFALCVSPRPSPLPSKRKANEPSMNIVPFSLISIRRK